MIIKIRQSITSTEYWDTEKKSIVVVSKGHKPKFELEDNSEVMITHEGKQTASVTIDESVINNDIPEKVKEENDIPIEAKEPSELDSMTIKQLRQYAKKNDIDIPSAVKVRGDIIALINDAK